MTIFILLECEIYFFLHTLLYLASSVWLEDRGLEINEGLLIYMAGQLEFYLRLWSEHL